MKKQSILLGILIFLLAPMIVYAASTVSVNRVGIYYQVISGDTSILNSPRYQMEINNIPFGSPAAASGVNNLTIYGTTISSIVDEEPPFTFRSNDSLGNNADIGLERANSSIIESGPIRTYIRYTNFTNSCAFAASVALCMNWTSDVYAYSDKAFWFQTMNGNYTSTSFYFYTFLFPPANMLNVVANLTLNGNPSTGSSDPLGNFTKSILMMFNTTNHNRSLLLFPSSFLNTTNDTEWGFNAGRSYLNENSDIITERAFQFGYGWMFGRNGNTAAANNATVFQQDFNQSYQAFKNQATITIGNGTYLGWNNASATYNFTPIGINTIVRFNFSTGTNNYTNPIFHVRNLSTGAAVNHTFFRNLTFGDQSWIRITNGTNFLIQEGNNSFMGYNYTLFMPNATLGNGTNLVYEYWLSSDSNPGTFNSTVFDEKTLLPLIFNITLFNGNSLETGINVTHFNSTMVGETEITINRTGYHQRRYYTNLVGSLQFNFTGYLLSDSEGIDISYHLYSNRAPFGEDGARIHFLRFINNSYQTITEQISDTEGKGVIWLDPSGIYKVGTDSADRTLFGNVSAYTPQSSVVLRINLGGETVNTPKPSYWDYYKNVNGNCIFINSTRILTCTWSDSSGLLSSTNVKVIAYNSTTQFTFCDNTSTSNNGTILCNFGSPVNRTFLWTMKNNFNGEPFVLASGSWTDFIATVVLGLTGVLIAMLIVMFSGFIGVQLGSPMMTVLMTLMGTGISTFFGLLSFGASTITIIMGLGVAGAVLIYKLGR